MSSAFADRQLLAPGGRVTTETLRLIADARTRIHCKDASHRPLAAEHDLIGLLGQREFSIASGLPMDISVRRQGDGRVNFTTKAGTTINVSTYRNPVHLLREADKPGADIHVLAGISESLETVCLIGWELDKVMLLTPKKTLPGYEILNHIMPAHALHSMSELYKIIAEEEESGRKYSW